MKLRGTDYGHIWGGSGVQGFYGLGDEYWRDKLPWPLRPDFDGMIFVAKTTTLLAREGNMELNDDLTPKRLFPDCIKISLTNKTVLNAVGLSGPGAEALLLENKWQVRRHPFLLSFMSVALTKDARLYELKRFVELLCEWEDYFNTPFALQINFSCPNTGLDTSTLVGEVGEALDIAGELGIPLVPKFSVTQITPDEGVEIAKHEHCDALCISNTIPWKDLPPHVKITNASQRSTRSPLSKYGGGGYSGPYALLLVRNWVLQAKAFGLSKPINAGGGILCKQGAAALMGAGADSVFIASVALLRPWRVAGIVKFVNDYYNKKETGL